MSKIKFKLDGNMEKMMIFDSGNALWLNFHVTKHIIIGNKTEGFDKVFGINIDNLDKIRKTQINNYECSVSKYSKLNETCKRCNYVDECAVLTKKLGESYLTIIVDGVQKDNQSQTHAHYDKKVTLNSTKRVEHILFVDQYGSSIISRKQKNNYSVVTCFRNTEFSNLSDMELSFKKYLSDFELIRFLNIKEWNIRFNGKRYNNAIKHIPENW